MIYIFVVALLLVVVSLLTIAGVVVEIRNLLRQDLWESWGTMVRRTFDGEHEIIVHPLPSSRKRKGGFGPDDPPRM